MGNKIENIENNYNGGSISPRDLKRNLAIEIVSNFYDIESAKKAEKNFDNLFIHKKNPIDMSEYIPHIKNELILTIMKKNKLIDSNSEGKRLISQGAVTLEGKKIDNSNLKLPNQPKKQILKVGKRRFLKIIIN